MKLLLAGGGTGGHVYPAIAIGQTMMAKHSCEIGFIGNKNSFESEKINNLEWPFFDIDITGINRNIRLSSLLFPWKLIKSLLASRRIIKDFCPDIVVGTGGYVSGPPLFMAAKMGLTTAIQEQNSYPGITSRILSRSVNAVYLGFADAQRFFNTENCHFTGNPVRAGINQADPKSSRKSFQLEDCKQVVLVFGGSQGAGSINRNFARIIERLMTDRESGIIWQTGPREFDEYKRMFGQKKNVKILPFIANMDEAFAASDLAVTRAGALTLAELAMVGMPSILIPYPFATGNHQYHNARSFEKEQAAVLIEDKNDFSEELVKKINVLLHDPEGRTRMSARIRSLAAPEAANIIADSLINLWKGKKPC